MAPERNLKIFGVALFAVLLFGPAVLADNPPSDASFQSRCQNAAQMNFPACANSPAECGSKPFDAQGTNAQGQPRTYKIYREPFNCLFLQEPIGGKTGYDLYKITPVGDPTDAQVTYNLWFGEALTAADTGPVQAVLAYEPGKEAQGSFGLLYNYLALVYNFMSGIIIGFVILVAIIGGIRMIVSSGNQDEFTKGRTMIIKALIGMAVWFTASVILYTINPTFFAF